jgi:hypothetical protein
MVEPETFTAIAIKFGTFIAGVASILSLALSISDRTPTLATKSGAEALGVVLHLTLIVAILYGVLWAVAERVFHWDYGAGGGGKMPSGWAAATLALSLTIPLGGVPFLYERLTGVGVVHSLHWRAMTIVALLGVGTHLLIYGTNSERPNGLRQAILPLGQHPTYGSSVLMEVIYAICYFVLMVVPYRLVADPAQPLRDLIVGRTLLPFAAFVGGMAFFIFLKYPRSMDDPTWIQTRGIIGGILAAFCLCGGMFM